MNVRRSARWLPLVFLLALLRPVGVEAQEKVFRLQGVDQTLVNVSPETDVYFRSMRLNRALNVWNVEVTVSNKTSRTLSGPVVLLIDSFQGTGGPVSPDGLDDSQPGKGFYALSVGSNPGPLVPAGTTAVRTLTLSRLGTGTVSPSLIAQVYAAPTPVVAALGVTRSLDEVGRPLPGVFLSVSGPKGTVQQVSDLPSGVASFGQGAGDHRVIFSADGYLPVWRRQMLATDSTAVLPNPRLTLRSDHPFAVTPAGGIVVSNSSASIQMLVPPGAVTAEAEFHLTPVTGQTLPAFLPQGWSPLSAFWIESSRPLQKALSAVLLPAGPIAAGETAALVRWNDQTLQWMVTATVSGNEGNAVTVPIDSAGAYALVVADAAELAPPAAQSGQPLLASAVSPPDVAGLTATGTVTPAVSPASVVPERVTGTARVELKHATAKPPSGWLLRGEVTETYLLLDGSIRLTPQYEHFIVGYQRPGDADSQTLGAEFPMRPVLLFGPEQLKEATVRVDVLPEQPFDGQVLDAKGGQMIRDGVRLIAGTGTLTAPSALRLRRLDATAFTNLVGNGHVLTAAFDLTVDGSTLGSHLSAQLGGVPANTRFVLARILSETGYFGLQPVERLQSDAQGTLLSLEPASGDRLPGLRGSGQFLLVQVNEPQGLIRGVARTGAGTVRANLPVSLAGLPWLALTDAQGRYELVAPAGSRELSVRDPATGDVGRVQVTLTNPGTPLAQDLDTAPRGPRVAKITPAADATRVPRVGSVVIEFDEAVNPASVVNAIQLLKPDNSPVPAAMVLNLANRIATLSPATELDANTVYRVSLAATISDPSGLPLDGVREFSFTTVPLSTRDPAAQLIIYQPGATNVPSAILDEIPAYEPGDDASAIVVHGTPGVADPEVPVILVNESTGETATVLSKPDGSFSSVIAGSESDYVSATFVNLNGTRVYVPVSRQLFDNGFVGLYPQGGILEAQSDGGPVQVLIQPNAVPNRTKFRIKTLDVSQLLRETGGVAPDLATVAGGGMKIEVEGQPPTLPMQVSFPVDLAQLGYPATENPTNAAAALAVVRDIQGVKTYEVVDQLVFEPTVPALALRRIRPNAFDPATAGLLHTLAGFGPGLIQFAPLVFDFIVVPLVLGARPVLVTGKAVQATRDESGGFADNFVFNEIDAALNGQALPGAFVILRNTPPIGPPGRLQPGMVHATSGADGLYRMFAPAANAGYILTATHPRYTTRHNIPVIPYLDIKFSGVIRKDLVFRDLAGADAPLRLNVAHAPVYPAPGQDCELQVSAFRGAGVVPEILVTVKSVTNLVGDIPAQFSDVTLTNISSVNNGTTRLWRGLVKASKSVQAVLKITADGEVATYPINFAGVVPPIVGGPLPKPDTNDVHGPIVISTFPPEGGYLGTGGEITLLFNKPIDRSIEQALSGVVLSGPLSPPKPVIRLSAMQNSLIVQYAGLEPDGEYTLTLTGEVVRDLAGQSLDQRPSTPEPDSFRLRFRSAPVRNAVLPELVNGRGSAISGQNLYVIESTQQGSSLLVFDISNPKSPSLRGRSRLFGQPRDLVVIPQYAYRRLPGEPAQTNELVAVVGGDLDTVVDRIRNVTVKGQYLTVFNMANPSVPEQLASPILSYRVGSSVTKVEWSPPNLVYHEFGSDLQLLGVVNLQELIIGYGDIQKFLDFYGKDPRPGLDSNRDGDYVDDGELVPIPPYPPDEFFGKRQNYVLLETTQKILDFSPLAGGDLIGITLTRGLGKNTAGQLNVPYPPSYRTLALNLETSDPTDSVYRFGNLAYPRWVTVFPSLIILSNDVPILPTAALVSLQPDEDGVQKLAILDITLPRTPRLINKVPIPEDILGGAMQSVRQREDGLLEVSGGKNVVLLDPRRLAVTNVPAGQVHPAIVGFVASAGAGTRSVGATEFGYHSVADGGRGVLVQTTPVLRFVNFPASPSVLDPSQLQQLTDQALTELTRSLSVAVAIPPARAKGNPKFDIPSDLDPPRPSAHFHVLVDAPGTSGETIELGLESVNHAGRPLSNFGFGFAPVRAISTDAQEAIGQRPRPDCGAPIRSLKAWRMSNNPHSPFFNHYLSKPFALLANETLSAVEQKRLQTILDREILHSGAGLRAFIDPSQAKNQVIGMFAARVDEKRKLLLPVAVQHAITLFHPYLMGDNPPPAGGYVALPATYGMVAAHSGEVRTEAADLELPSRRMPIIIQRVIGNQDSYEGPFGVGWDFNYNQRITELDPLSFPLGLQMPLIVRGTKEDSDIAGSQDVLLNTGMGRVLRFRWVATNMPPEYAADPLVAELNYRDLVSDYFLPAKGQGIFDLLVKLKDGRFERLTPDGTRYRYAGTGRLEMIIDRFPLNRHELEYDRNGWLVRIDDRSVRAPRYVEFGYYRTSDDPDFREGLDEVTLNGQLDGKIRRLRNHANDPGSDVLFVYSDDGFLIRRDGVKVDGENEGFRGRAQTHYTYKNCRFAGIKVTGKGAPLFAADTVENANGKLVARGGAGMGGNVAIDVPLENSAASVANQISSANLADQSKTDYKFDKYGHVVSATSSGAKGAAATTTPAYNEDGLNTFIRHPEGNSVTKVYDSGNPIFRSRGNLISQQIDTGPRGGAGYTLEFSYDPHYNLPAGSQRNANGFVITQTLRPDKRETESVRHGAAGRDDFAFNEYGQPVLAVNSRGIRSESVYDSSTGFLKSQKLGDNSYTSQYDAGYASLMGFPSKVLLPEGAPLQLKYNRKLQTVEQSRGELRELMGYDERGRRSFGQRFLGDGKAPTSHWEYDEVGFLHRTVTQNVDVDGVDGSIEYVFTPDELSRVKSIRLPQGTLQTQEFDNRGNLIRRTLGDYVEEYELDLDGNPTRVKKGGEIVGATVYDGLGRPTIITQHTGTKDEVRRIDYYQDGQVKSQTVSDDEFGLVEDLKYDEIDELGRPVTKIISGNTIQPIYSYKYERNSDSETGPRMTIKSTWNDSGYPLSRESAILTEKFTPDGNGKTRKMELIEDGATYAAYFQYDSLDNVESYRDNLGLLSRYGARADGKLLKVINGNDHATDMDHSVNGELLRQKRADGMEIQKRYDGLRQSTFTGDPAAGYASKYDESLRLKSTTQRNGAVTTYGSFDPRQLPRSVGIPGGHIEMRYDLKQRMVEKTVTYLTTSYSETRDYDALDRIRVIKYSQDGEGQNTATYGYDLAGPLLSARFQEDGNDFTVGYEYYDDGSRKNIKYPSGIVVTEHRDNAGRLTGVSDQEGTIVRADAWQGNDRPKAIEMGPVNIANQYDARGRLTGSRATRASDGAVLAHMRYQYDAANNLELRQFLHRGGRTDGFSYDSGERVTAAKMGGLPNSPGSVETPLYRRDYSYDKGGLDFITSVSNTNLGLSPPPFASTWTDHDAFLLPGKVDGFDRAPADPGGNVPFAVLPIRLVGSDDPAPRSVSLVHNGKGSLIRVRRDDGVLEENFYQPDGLRYRRRVTNGAQVLDHRHFVYDSAGRLLEEYDLTTGAPFLIGRYFYATGDAPEAADIYDHSSGQLRRCYFLRDATESVIAVVDADGNAVERAWYDTFGQPLLEEKDSSKPVLSSVTADADGALLIALSESVMAPFSDPGPGEGIVPVAPLAGGAVISVSVSSGAIAGTVELLPSFAGHPPFSVFKFVPSEGLPTTPNGVLGWWPSDIDVSDVAAGNSGALRGGATLGSGLIQQAFALNGASAFVEITNAAAVNFGTGDFTVSAWVNFDTVAGEQVLAEKWSSPRRSGWSLVKRSDQRLRLALGNGAGGELALESAGPLNFATNAWIQIAARRQGSQFTLFTNGVSVAAGSLTGSLNSPATLKFGSREGTSSFLHGRIDEVTISSRALSDQEIVSVAGGVAVPGPVIVTLNAGKAADEWGNLNEGAEVSFMVADAPGVVFYSAQPAPRTAAPRIARSSLGSPFLFHGQYFDYDTGLIYLRARFYDPFSGMFLEPDPMGYEDSVNPYAGMGNNPVGFRDPTGLFPGVGLLGKVVKTVASGLEHVHLQASGINNGFAKGFARFLEGEINFLGGFQRMENPSQLTGDIFKTISQSMAKDSGLVGLITAESAKFNNEMLDGVVAIANSDAFWGSRFAYNAMATSFGRFTGMKTSRPVSDIVWALKNETEFATVAAHKAALYAPWHGGNSTGKYVFQTGSLKGWTGGATGRHELLHLGASLNKQREAHVFGIPHEIAVQLASTPHTLPGSLLNACWADKRIGALMVVGAVSGGYANNQLKENNVYRDLGRWWDEKYPVGLDYYVRSEPGFVHSIFNRFSK